MAAFRKLAARDTMRQHTPTEEPEAADLVLFVDNHMNPDWRVRAMLEHPLLKQFPEKCMVYDERDHPWSVLPGVYVSMPAKYFDTGSQRAWCYYTLSEKTAIPSGAKPDLLYSFIGTPGPRTSKGNKSRMGILSLRDGRALIEDSSGFIFYDDQGDAASHATRQRRFADAIGRSKFVLCPRGNGTSSIRMYEVMRSGRVPIIIADQWVAPIGPDWKKCSLHVPEIEVAGLPELLRKVESNWEEMAESAKIEYEKWCTLCKFS